ncbi:MAG: substrate-binding domain-containing protein [Verrucomicrobia bacterium]|nr:substrate-binding domain-containing protein [Verrucomicrobiota bacterium]
MVENAERRIALFMPRFAWAIRAGITRYSAPPMLWDTINYERSPQAFLDARRWHPHGCIGMLGRVDLVKHARRLPCPIVNIHGGRMLHRGAQVGCDHEAIGAMAADHLATLGFPQFACIGFPGEDPNDDQRLCGFLRALPGRQVDVFDVNFAYPGYKRRRGALIEPDDETLHRWVGFLRKPCAVFASGDMMAARVLRAALHLGIRVPEEIAILGVGDIPEFCLDQPILISSVIIPWEQIGHEAAVQLDRMMEGGDVSPAPVRFRPTGIAVRRSSDTYAVGDRVIAGLLRYIRTHACEGIGVADLLTQTTLGRRVLERRFRSLLGRSPHEEIQRVRLDKVVQMLLHTDATLETIAGESGLGSTSRLSVEFKKRFGQSPGAYRNSFQPRS